MKITRTSLTSGIERTMEIPVTQQQLDRWQAGALIQTVMPNLTTNQREFLISGMTMDEWEDEFGEEDADGDFEIYDEPAF